MGISLPVVLDDMGKSMVIRKVAGMKRSKLGLYGHHLEQSGFINQLKSQISELYQYGITPDMLSEVMREAGNPLLKQKLEDLELIYSGFRQYIEEHYITAEEILDILCRELPKWEILRDSVILLDGFTGFTPVQYRLVELFLLHARKVLCSVTIDEGQCLSGGASSICSTWESIRCAGWIVWQSAMGLPRNRMLSAAAGRHGGLWKARTWISWSRTCTDIMELSGTGPQTMW